MWFVRCKLCRVHCPTLTSTHNWTPLFSLDTHLAKIDINVKPIFTSKKLLQTLGVKENKPPIVNTQCVVYLFQCDFCLPGYLWHAFPQTKTKQFYLGQRSNVWPLFAVVSSLPFDLAVRFWSSEQSVRTSYSTVWSTRVRKHWSHLSSQLRSLHCYRISSEVHRNSHQNTRDTSLIGCLGCSCGFHGGLAPVLSWQ